MYSKLTGYKLIKTKCKIKVTINSENLSTDHLICFEKNELCKANNITNNVYKVNDDSRKKKDFFNKLMETLKNKGCTIDLISISDYTNKISFTIKKNKFSEGDYCNYIIPRSYLFLNQTVEYIGISTTDATLDEKSTIIHQYGGYSKKKIVKKVKSKKHKSKIVKKVKS